MSNVKAFKYRIVSFPSVIKVIALIIYAMVITSGMNRASAVTINHTDSCPLPAIFDEMAHQNINIVSSGANGLDTNASIAVLMADNPKTRSAGFQHVCKQQADTPILFVFSSEEDVSFHMRNVNIALQIFFFRSDGLLVDRFLMTPYVEAENTLYSPSSKIQYALEVPLHLIESIPELQNIKQIAL